MPDTATVPPSYLYWETRYSGGGNSGAGSYNRLAQYKAAVLNDFVLQNHIHSVIEHGCGDGNQLGLAQYPQYLGLDVSPSAIRMCAARFQNDAGKKFKLAGAYAGETADLALSLDVIYHLVEDAVYAPYMRGLFSSAAKYVIIYSSDMNENSLSAPHVRHRAFSAWIKNNCPAWSLIGHLPNLYPYTEKDPHNTSLADFYFYKKQVSRLRGGTALGRRRRAAL